MDKKWILLLFVILVLMTDSALGLTGQKLPEQSPKIESPDAGWVCIEDNCFSVEIASTQAQKEHGLMNREYLAPNSGMLFVFNDKGGYSFWMKNTLIPLDIIWIDSNYEIIYIQKNAQPCPSDYYCPSFGPGKNASYVLEINGGLSDKYGIDVGDRVNISYGSDSSPRENLLNKKHSEIYRIIWKFIGAYQNILGNLL
ncbi:MAG: DUF192 domain-containing protein [Methanosarcina sp.]